jgi:LuxR family maltose regulon positive regulatory protein
VLSALSRLALAAMRRGELGRARAYCDQADALVAGADTPIPAAGLTDVVRGMIAYQHNHLAGAQRALEQGVERLRGWIDFHLLVLGMCTQARCYLACGDFETAHAVLNRAEAWLHLRQIQGASQLQVAAERALLWLRQGQLDEAARWGEVQLPAATARQPRAVQLTLVRLWLAQTRADGEVERLGATCAMLRTLREEALAHGRLGELNDVELLEALALVLQGQDEAATERAATALGRLESEGALRVAADEGAPLVPLLHQVAARHRPLRLFVHRILRVIGPPDPSQLADSHGDARDALTARETEVLRLLADGHSTAAIAGHLVVSQGTVKRHVANILRKLAAHTRLEAVARARASGLL